MSKKKNNKGFTLVELLVVIAIIGILAVVAVPALFKNINKAKVADLESDYNAFKSASLSYYAEKNTYPIGVTGAGDATDLKKILDGEMESVPTKSPLSTTDGKYEIKEVKTSLDSTVNNSLALIANKNKITEAQAEKLVNEFGDVVGVIDQRGEFTKGEIDTLKGEDQTIAILLMQNTSGFKTDN